VLSLYNTKSECALLHQINQKIENIFLVFQIRPAGQGQFGFPTHVRSGTSAFGKTDVPIDQAHGWVLEQACAEGKTEGKPVKITFPGVVSVEVPTTPTVLAAIFGGLNLVLLGVISYLVKLLRVERSRHSHGPLTAVVPPHRVAAQVRRGLPGPGTPAITTDPVGAGALALQPVGATAPPLSLSPAQSLASLYQDARC
jgi:hypothetical protein